MTIAEDWTKEWERQIVNGMYPLRRFLGRSNHSVVFLTECSAPSLTHAAIKILPVNPALMELQLEHWRMVATLSHPRLIRLLDAGRCRLGGSDFLFVVMEHAEQTLAQILPGRPLTPDEVQELLPATLDALAYLHARNLVHGALSPPNFLVVDDQLKLASDTIRAAGERTASTAKPSFYDPPEAMDGRASIAGDVWALGITLVEALTQAPPAWSREGSVAVALPANLASEFVDTVRRCLNRDPDQRPTIAELVAHFKSSPPATSQSAAPSVVNEPAGRTQPAQNSLKTLFVLIAVTVGILVLWAIWTGAHLFHAHADVQQAVSMPPRPRPATSPPPAAGTQSASIAVPLPAVLHQEIPDISHGARESIRGVIRIAVRVIVDRSGNVVAATLDHRASSQYFARAAMDAAKQWKFAQTADPASRVWLLHFEFARAGATAHADARQ